MTPSCKEALLRCAVTWNTNSKNAEAAQVYQETIIKIQENCLICLKL